MKSHIDEQKVSACEQMDESRNVIEDLNEARMKLTQMQKYSNLLETEIRDRNQHIERFSSKAESEKVRGV